ncbi:YgeY family selenium metabolism-linked hydrolase [Salmonella enterica]|uniref:YgeY family selenium metabolism-linked hydrolase n=1 Tax=Salmonella enterica subsp. enterica serovar Panama TaxID=29472 RepID=A0A5U8JDZ9_SALET|nr:YgeY family selenium metabolism-linked hydrolase [Salmonella enterica]EBR7996406.1 YgeY family selenium metabolism-linked hydrolase [Salmonella enterica subsp. enterica serovar Panama]ASD87194.1 YgeY family selenium metabolism-linked hydrolase [Salmonella enterica subsp. enterica serovar India str. SA20085604]EBR8435666.1 YgeY family selenium metabolism-linked hydrolase [Salmonella enterica subsp. enterica serovar Panama]EBW9462841.1 YgeY family selenium metabolism-linked hydrolase [Salmonel
MLSSTRIDEVIKNCQALIQQKSYSGQEGNVVNTIEKMMRLYQFDDIHVDKYGNIIGGIIGKLPGKTLVLDGHIDTVPVNEEKWTRNPYGGDIEDGKIYGRGTTDMKGAVAAMISAVGFYGQDNQRNFAGKIYVACIVHEECFEGIAARLVSERYHPDYVVIGEASELNLKIGQRGRAEIVVETFGKPAHSANPQAGINAVYKMAQLINKIRTLTPPSHQVLGPGIMELTDIKSSPYPGASVVPDYCRATYDRRLLVGETKDSVLAPLKKVLEDMACSDAELNAKVSYAVGHESCYTGTTIEGERFFPGWVYDESDKFVQAALAGIRAAGFNPTITQYSFCTNGSHYAGEAGIKTIGFGPSRENLAHIIDEYIETEQLTGSASGYYSIIRTLYGH